MKSRKAQVWGLDLMIACIIFFSGLIVLYNYSTSFSKQAEENLDSLFYEGNAVSSLLLTEGYPLDWGPDNVLTPGLTTQNKINETKLGMASNLSSIDYKKFKRILNTNYDFYFFLSSSSGNVEGAGKPGINSTNIMEESPENIVKITRFTIYKNKPVQFELYIWK